MGCSLGTLNACRRSRSTTPSIKCPGRTCSITGQGLRPKDFRFAIKASRRITHAARLNLDTPADSVALLYRNLATLGVKRGPVLFQLPPYMKKDLPRLAEILHML